jgi:hypothetical protein
MAIESSPATRQVEVATARRSSPAAPRIEGLTAIDVGHDEEGR